MRFHRKKIIITKPEILKKKIDMRSKRQNVFCLGIDSKPPNIKKSKSSDSHFI
jgi:hypothetical protein